MVYCAVRIYNNTIPRPRVHPVAIMQSYDQEVRYRFKHSTYDVVKFEFMLYVIAFPFNRCHARLSDRACSIVGVPVAAIRIIPMSIIKRGFRPVNGYAT